MYTLTTGFQTGFTNELPMLLFLDISIRDNGTAKNLFLTNVPSGLNTWNYKGATASGVQSSYLAATIINNGQEVSVDGVGEMDTQLDPSNGGSISAVSQLNIILLNQGNFSSSHSYDFENQQIHVYRTFANPTGTIIVESGMLFFDGVITQAYDYDNTQFMLQCIDRRTLDSRNIPAIFIPTSTLPAGINNPFPSADKNAQGKFIPFLLGDFYTPNTILISGLNTWFWGKMSAAPTVITDIYKNYAYASDDVYSVTGPLFITDDSTKYISVLSGIQFTVSPIAGVTSLSGINCIQVFPGYGEMIALPIQGFHPEVGWVPVPPGTSVGDWVDGTYVTDIAGAVDADPTTYVTIDKKWNGGGFFNNIFLQVQAPSFTEPGTLINAGDTTYHYAANIDFYLGGIFEFTGGAVGGADGVGDFEMFMMDSQDVRQYKRNPFPTAAADTPFKHEFALSTLTLGSDLGNWTNNIGATWDLVKRLYFAFGPDLYNLPGDDGTKKLKIHHLWLRARTRYENTGILKEQVAVPQFKTIVETTPFQWGQPALNLTSRQVISGYTYEVRGKGISNLFVPAKGPVYTSDMTRSNGHSTSDLIENPAHAIEYMLRYKLKVPSANIDTTSFDALGDTTNGTRKDWKVAGSILERKIGFEHIGEICKEFHMSLVNTSDGKYKTIAHETISGIYTIQPGDIYFDGYPQIWISQTDNNSIYNDYILNYAYDYTTSKTKSSIFVSDINGDTFLENNITNTGALRGTYYTTWCDDSRTRYGGAIRQFKLDSMFIQDAATAELSLKKTMDWLAFKRLKVKMYANPSNNTMALQVGDVIMINNTILTSLFSSIASFVITRINYPSQNKVFTQPYITIECLELPSANTGTPIYTSRFISSEDLIRGT